MKKTSNTPHKGSFRNIVFKDRDTWYAVALEFNIVESSDDPKLAFFNLLRAVDGYVESMKKVRGTKNFAALNQTPDPEYVKLWDDLHSGQPLKSPFQVNMFGVATV